ncbi:MAG: hypothetical protein COB04_15150 [Gammaproteobacteria bacterium]|nr:MAG: hypothetical protein COB04_15150 [Gammaproteobacteria bacterium]
MPGKVWEYDDGKICIEFKNRWKLTPSIPSEETLSIDGEVLSSVRKSVKDGFKNNVVSEHKVYVEKGGKSYDILVKLGSKWPGILTGCHIYVNGELVGGDAKSKLIFT